MNICNNERLKIINIDGNIRNEYKAFKFDAVENLAFQRYFRVSTAGTAHSSLGMTINKPFLIHILDKYCNHMKYVSISCCNNKNKVNIYFNKSSIDDFKQTQHKQQLKQRKLL